MYSLSKRTLTWLCLILVLVTGIAPARGLVLCIEADGCVRVELATTDTTCGDCDTHTEGGSTSRTASRDADCPCIDVSMPGTAQDQRGRSASTVLQSGTWIATHPGIPSQRIASAPFAVCSMRVEPPRSPEVLSCIRTVVLLV